MKEEIEKWLKELNKIIDDWGDINLLAHNRDKYESQKKLHKSYDSLLKLRKEIKRKIEKGDLI